MTLQNLWFDRPKGMVSPYKRYGLAASYHTSCSFVKNIGVNGRLSFSPPNTPFCYFLCAQSTYPL